MVEEIVKFWKQAKAIELKGPQLPCSQGFLAHSALSVAHIASQPPIKRPLRFWIGKSLKFVCSNFEILKKIQTSRVCYGKYKREVASPSASFL